MADLTQSAWPFEPENLKTWPAEVWLNHGTGRNPPDYAGLFKGEGGVTWCAERVENEDVRYVRADLAAAKDARIAELERQLSDSETERKRVAFEMASAVAAVPPCEPGTGDYADIVRGLAGDMVHAAGILGQVLTITQRPLQPLAMGNYETVVEVRPARVRS